VLRLPNGAIRYLGRFSAHLHVHTSSLSSLLSFLPLLFFANRQRHSARRHLPGNVETRRLSIFRGYRYFTRDAIVSLRHGTSRVTSSAVSSPSIFIAAYKEYPNARSVCNTLHYRAPLIISESTLVSVVERVSANVSKTRIIRYRYEGMRDSSHGRFALRRARSRFAIDARNNMANVH